MRLIVTFRFAFITVSTLSFTYLPLAVVVIVALGSPNCRRHPIPCPATTTACITDHTVVAATAPPFQVCLFGNK